MSMKGKDLYKNILQAVTVLKINYINHTGANFWLTSRFYCWGRSSISKQEFFLIFMTILLCHMLNNNAGDYLCLIIN